MTTMKLNGFRVVFSPVDEESTIRHVAVTLEAADAEEAVEKSRLAMEFKRENWRVFRVSPERVE